MTTFSYHISNLLEKMTSSDKDFRFMATNDLMTELQKDSIKLDDDCEKKVVRMLLKLLEDKNGEVQNLAVKCLGPLVGKVKELQVETIVDILCQNMITGNEQLRDISSIGLKTVISELPPSSTNLIATICKKITIKLANAIAQQDDVTIQLESLEILSDLLNRFGPLLVAYHHNIQEALMPQLMSPRLAVRKRAITAISYLAMCCSQALYIKTVDKLLEELNKNVSASNARTYIQCIAAVARQAGHRFGEYLERVMPLVCKYCKEEDDELKEYCIQAFESFVRKCPREISSHVGTIVKVCLNYLCYDPNYNYDDEMDDEDMEMDNEEEEEESNDEYSDDDDMSWKVRRSSAKCLEAIISTRHDMIIDFYKVISPSLIARYKEREENVKVDIFNAYIALLKQTRPFINSASTQDAQDHSAHLMSVLRDQVSPLVRSLHKQLREKSIKTRQSCFHLLSELVYVLPGALEDHISNLIPGVLYSLSDKNTSSNMKIDTLSFLNVLFKTHKPEVFHKHVHILLPAIINAVGDHFYKIISEALLVLTQMIQVIRPLSHQTEFNFKPHVLPIYECTFAKLKAADIDQEVKERAITCMGQIINTFGDEMENKLSQCLPLLLDRLRNEITRLTCVKALTKIAVSPFKISLNPLLPEALPVLASFLRKNQRALKLSTLILLDSLVKNYPGYLTSETIGIILNEVPPLISESDLHISQLTLAMITSFILSQQAFLAIIPQTILPEALVLIRSPLLQGSALNSMLEFFQAIIQTNFPGLSFDELVQRLTQPIYHPNRNQLTLHKQAYHSIAKCMSAISVIDTSRALMTVRMLLQEINGNKESDAVQLFALLTLGEIGKSIDLSSIKEVKDVIIESFNSSSEEVKTAASFALGSVSVGNLQVYLPFVLSEINTRQKRQYLLLHSLKEIISCQSVNPSMIQLLEPHLESIWQLLLHHSECLEEGTRNVVAECLGKLTLLKPQVLLPKLQQYLTSQSALARATVVTAMKFTISDQPQLIDNLLRSSIGDFLKTLQDPDINVRRVALVAFNSAAHNKPSLIRDLLDSTLPQLYNETKVRKELIREVEMGPFKHTVDDGLDIRKAAFECMYTLLDSCLDRIDIFEFLNHVEDGLKDHYDIKMLTYLMLVRLSTLCPSAVLQRLEKLIDPLKQVCMSKVKSNAVKQEYEKQDELKRSAMRAFLALLAIPDADKNPLMTDFLSQIKSTPDLQTLFESIQKDSTNANENALPMDVN